MFPFPTRLNKVGACKEDRIGRVRLREYFSRFFFHQSVRITQRRWAFRHAG